LEGGAVETASPNVAVVAEEAVAGIAEWLCALDDGSDESAERLGADLTQAEIRVPTEDVCG